MTREEAVQLAQEVARAEGWPWHDPIDVAYFRRWLIGPKCWRLTTNFGSRGGNVRVLLEDRTGNVYLKVYWRR